MHRLTFQFSSSATLRTARSNEQVPAACSTMIISPMKMTCQCSREPLINENGSTMPKIIHVEENVNNHVKKAYDHGEKQALNDLCSSMVCQ
jgi:hypothetical protein